MILRNAIFLGMIALLLFGCANPTGTSAPPVETEAPVEASDMETAEQTVEIEEPEQTEAPVETEDPANAEGEMVDAGVVFTIVSEESEARFKIDEVLLGEDFTVVGTTSAVTGQISGDESDPANAQVSVDVDVRTLVTDNGRRDGATQRFILETGVIENQVATFRATSISGLPAEITVGEQFEFQITGELTAHGMTKELTFDGSATLVNETRLEGSASTETLFTEFVSVFSLPPQVASVEEALILEIDFVAVR